MPGAIFASAIPNVVMRFRIYIVWWEGPGYEDGRCPAQSHFIGWTACDNASVVHGGSDTQQQLLTSGYKSYKGLASAII